MVPGSSLVEMIDVGSASSMVVLAEEVVMNEASDVIPCGLGLISKSLLCFIVSFEVSGGTFILLMLIGREKLLAKAVEELRCTAVRQSEEFLILAGQLVDEIESESVLCLMLCCVVMKSRSRSGTRV